MARVLRVRRVLLQFLVASLLVGLPAAWLLPVASAWENALLENLQVVLLVSGAALAWRFARSASGAALALGHAVAPLWLILAARELSWGASVLTAPLAMRWSGPLYSSSLLAYKPFVYPALGLVLLACIVFALRGRVLALLEQLLTTTPFVWAELGLAVVAILVATYAEGNMPGLPTPASLGQRALVLEEWTETVAYLALLAAQWHLFALLRARAQPMAAAFKAR